MQFILVYDNRRDKTRKYDERRVVKAFEADNFDNARRKALELVAEENGKWINDVWHEHQTGLLHDDAYITELVALFQLCYRLVAVKTEPVAMFRLSAQQVELLNSIETFMDWTTFCEESPR